MRHSPGIYMELNVSFLCAEILRLLDALPGVEGLVGYRPDGLLTQDAHHACRGRLDQLTTDAAVTLLHRTAVERGIHQYVDPDTGFIVQTAAFLSKRECCGMSCRHCPHEHVNVDHSSRRRRR